MTNETPERLSLIGLGLCDEKDISYRGMEEMMAADEVFAEHYTSRLAEGSLDRLSEATGKDIVMLSREEVEEGTRIIDSSKAKRVAFLVVGDPLTATTHVDLRLRAARESVDTAVVICLVVPALLSTTLVIRRFVQKRRKPRG